VIAFAVDAAEAGGSLMSEETVDASWNKDVFVALAAIGWADGTLDPDEADAIVRAAVDLGLELQEIADIEEATRTPIGLKAIDTSELSKDDRLFVYAIACWIARLDGTVTDEESGALAGLAETLEIPERRRAVAEKRAAEIAALPEGDRPARYDLARLRSVLST
jgi:uncharacterized membrane protein YebE (DUF533 family)